MFFIGLCCALSNKGREDDDVEERFISFFKLLLLYSYYIGLSVSVPQRGGKTFNVSDVAHERETDSRFILAD